MTNFQTQQDFRNKYRIEPCDYATQDPNMTASKDAHAHPPDVRHVVEVPLDVPAQRLGHALAERGVRAAPVAEGEAHDLPLGEDGQHDAALHADGDDDDHDGAGELLSRHGWWRMEGRLD